MPRILAIADEVDESLGPQALAHLDPQLVLSCGDLPFEYLEYLVTMANVPLLYVPGNHDPDLHQPPIEPSWLRVELKEVRDPSGPLGCSDVDGRVVDAAGLRVAGLGGSVRYREGPNQYTQREMNRRARRLTRRAAARRIRDGHAVDVIVAHAPPFGLGDDEDPAHRGFEAFGPLIERLSPRLFVHGHIHPHGQTKPDRQIRSTTVVNAVPWRLLEIPS